MTKRIFKGIFWMSLITALICAIFTIGLLYEHYNGLLKEDIRGRAEYVAAGVEHGGIGYLEKISYDDNRITLIAADGTVLFDSYAEAEKMANHGDRQEFLSALENGTGETKRTSDTLAEVTYYYAIRLEDGSVLRAAGTQRTALSTMLIVLYPILFLVVAIVILSAILSNSIAKNIVAPINAMDIKNPEEGACYEELTPLLHRINYQNRKIVKQIEELRHKQREFTLISDNMSEGLLVIDRDNDILSVNNSMLKLFDKDESIVGRNAFLLDRSEGFRAMLAAVRSGEHISRIQEIGGRFYEITANPVMHEGIMDGAVILYVDVTEKEEREKLRREFSSNVSHELKTPLASIYGVSDMLMNGMVREEDVGSFAKDINSEAKRLMELIEDIIDLSRLDDENAPIEFEEVDVYEIVKGEISHLMTAADERNITISLHGGSAVVIGEPRLIGEAAHNLIENAVKYNIEGGRVDVSVNCGAEVTLKVKDTGIGIAPEYQERIFERFFRVDKSHSKRIGGTGLGLSIVKHAIRLHGGRIEIDSALGKGTEIRAVFPKNRI